MRKRWADVKKRIGKTVWQRSSLTLMLYVGVISFAAFYTVKVDAMLYLPIAVMLWMILRVNYQMNKNCIFYEKASLVFLVNLAVYVMVKFLQCGFVPMKGIHVGYGVYGAALLCFFIFLEKEECEQEEKAETEKAERETQKDTLFRERVWDLERLIQLIETENLVGIDSPWGSGKTFLLRALKEKKEIKEKYVFIEMNLLACNLDEIQTILLNELERILFENGIFSRYSRKLKGLLGEKGLISHIGSALLDNGGTFAEAMAGLNQEIEGLGKTVIVVYEDMDRIGDGRVIRKILSIAENMAAGGVKTIFQYDEQNLQRMDKEFDHAYLNKFIHITMRLSEISFFSGLSYLLETRQYGKWVELEDFRYLNNVVFLDYNLSKLLGYQIHWKIQIQGAAIRNIQLFLQEIEATLQNNPSYQNKERRREVITFYVIKHFMYDLYQSLCNMQDKWTLLDAITVKYKEKTDTLPAIINSLIKKDGRWSAEQVRELLSEETNQKRISVIQMFGYSLDLPLEQDFGKIGEMTDSMLQRRRLQEQNEQKDRLIQNLLYAGYSGETSQKMAVMMLRTYVLDQDEKMWRQGFLEFQNRLFKNNFERTGNRTIFYIGHDEFMDLFRTFWMADASEEDWTKFLNFYFQYSQIKEINAQLIENLNYCNLRYKNVYLFILSKFNELKIVGNFNKLKSYRLFLKRYLRALSNLTFIDTDEVDGLEQLGDVGIKDTEFVKKWIIGSIKKRLMGVAERLKELPSLQRDIQIILTFLDKNMKIIECNEEGTVPERNIKTKWSSGSKYQEEFERLRDFEGNEKQYREEVDKSYREGKIGVYKILDLPRYKK